MMEKEGRQIWQDVLSRGTAISDLKKHRIIEATIRLIAGEGIEAVTFERIGQLLKTTKTNVKYHFADKSDLIFTAGRLVVSNAQMITAARVEKVGDPAGKLHAVVDGAYDWYQRFPEHVRVWALFIYYSHIFEPYTQFFNDTRATGQNRMQLLLRALPHSESNPNYGRLAESIQNIIYGQVIGLAGRTKDLRANKADTEATIAALLFSKGIKWS